MSLSGKIREINHKRIDAGRALVLKIVRALFDHAPAVQGFKKQPSGARGAINKILVLRLDGKLGDCVTSTGFFMHLHKIFPDAKITVLTAPQTTQIYQSFSFLDVHPIKKGLIGTLKVWFLLKAETFDVSVNTSHMMAARTVFLMSTIQSHMKISMNCPNYSLFTDHALFDILTDHVTVRYQKVLQKMGIPAEREDLSYHITLNDQAKAFADARLRKLEAPYIVINSFAGARFRSFSEETTVSLVKHYVNKYPDHKIVSIGNVGDLSILQGLAR